MGAGEFAGQLADGAAHLGDNVVASAFNLSTGADGLDLSPAFFHSSDAHIGAAQINANGERFHCTYLAGNKLTLGQPAATKEDFCWPNSGTII
jgi:hypothetical protein